jgi:diguanylate cyclase (GGDEF)-like protein/PAS domain S-box-containing protein
LFLGILFIYYINKFYKSLLIAEQKFKSFFYNLPLPSFIVDVESGRFIDANNSAVKFYGYSKDELLNISIEKINVSNSPQELKIFRRTTAAKGGGVTIFKHKLKNGEIKIVQPHIAAITLNNKQCLLVIILDITEKIASENALKESEELFRIMSENLIIGIVLYQEKYIYANPMAENILGYSKDELYQKYVWDVYPDEHDKELIKEAIEKRLKGEMFNSTYTLKVLTKQNKEIWLLISVSTVKYKDKYTALASFIDITDKILEEQNILKEKENYKILSEFDVLTGIYNRRAYEIKLEGMLNAAVRYKRPLSLIMFDIDDFKNINDMFGHATGDSVLKEIASAIKEGLRATDFFARIGGEEFMIITSETSLEMATNLAERFRAKIENYNFTIGTKITLSFGVSAYRESITKENLEYFVDLALYEAKQKGKNRVEVVS